MFPVERSSSPGSLLLGHAQGGFLDMVDFHTFLQDVLETGGIDMGMYLFEFSLRVLKMSVVTCSSIQGSGSEKAKQAFF